MDNFILKQIELCKTLNYDMQVYFLESFKKLKEGLKEDEYTSKRIVDILFKLIVNSFIELHFLQIEMIDEKGNLLRSQEDLIHQIKSFSDSFDKVILGFLLDDKTVTLEIAKDFSMRKILNPENGDEIDEALAEVLKECKKT